MKRITVYCSSSQAIDDVYFTATERLANEFLLQDIEVIFGGGAVGLMGKLADCMVAGGGRIKGIMPSFMKEVEWAHQGVKDFEFVPDMHERKRRFLIDVDALVTLPGGSGSLEELFEAITLKRLGRFFQPIIILNTNGFYEPLRKQLSRCITERFMHPNHEKLWTFVNEPEEVLPAIAAADTWGPDAINYATLRKSRNE